MSNLSKQNACHGSTGVEPTGEDRGGAPGAGKGMGRAASLPRTGREREREGEEGEREERGRGKERERLENGGVYLMPSCKVVDVG